MDCSFIFLSFIMASTIHKFFKRSHVSIPIQDLFFILIILQKISKIFIFQSMILTSIGSTIGILFSYVLIQLQNKFKLISVEQNIYFVDYLPMEFNLSNSLLIIIISVILSFIISASSVKRFAYFSPMNVLRTK